MVGIYQQRRGGLHGHTLEEDELCISVLLRIGICVTDPRIVVAQDVMKHTCYAWYQSVVLDLAL